MARGAHGQRSRTATAALAMMLGVVALSGSPAHADESTVLAGQVLDHRQLPVAGVQVDAYRWGENAWVAVATTTTDNGEDGSVRGRYKFEGLPPGTYRVGFQPSELYVPEFYGDAATVAAAADVTLVAGATKNLHEDLFPSTQLSGRVTDQLGAGLEFVTVRIYRMKNGEWQVDEGNYAYTTPDGRYRIGVTHPGPYRLVYLSPTYSDEFWPGAWDILAADDIDLPLYATRDEMDIHLAPPGRVTGRAVSDTFAGGIRYPQARVWRFEAGRFVQEAEVRGDDEGRFVFEQLDPGRYRLHVADEMMNHHSEFLGDTDELDEATDFLVSPGAVTSIGDLELEWSAPYTTFSIRPKISGTGRVDGELTATRAHWYSGSGRWTYQWLANGKPIKGATSLRYSPTPADAGKLISFRETQFQPYSMPTPATSTPVRVKRGELRNAKGPSIVGRTAVGSELLVRPGRWVPSKVVLSYKWFLGNRRIVGVNDRTLSVVREHLGKRISVKVTAMRAGYRPVTIRVISEGVVRPARG